MNSGSTFQLFGPAHLVVILLTIVIPLGLGFAVRLSGSQRIDRAVAFCLALLLATNYFGYAVYLWSHQLFVWRNALPFQLCDWAMFTIIVALFTRRRGWTEVAYFWGIGGTFQAILTPNLRVGFPDIRFISFFIGHCGIVAGVIYLLLARRFRPTLGSVWRILAWSQLYLVATLLVDRLTNVNYGFLLHKPEAPSILDYLSDTRWLYLLGLEGLALLFFALLYAPFAGADLIRHFRAKNGVVSQA
ncbi:MAG: TIGR02206 family membrane protein [Spartobacteria bacterium]